MNHPNASFGSPFYASLRGFNYQPSYGVTGFEIWQNFNGRKIREEIEHSKAHFPSMNALRLWLAWDSFKANPARFAENFETLLSIADDAKCLVMPVLFNRWHNAHLDYGGIYLDHFLPGANYLLPAGPSREDVFQPYIEAIVAPHAEDSRIFAWDICNEPFMYQPAAVPAIEAAEFAWLSSIYARCKEAGAVAPLTVGIHPLHGKAGLERVGPISDILSIHPYWRPEAMTEADYSGLLDSYVAYARECGKPLIATEACWGDHDDSKHVELIRHTLTQLKSREIGWLAYLLHHSLIADAHAPEFGPVAEPGNLAFLNADGTLRAGHDVFNEF